MPRRQKISNEGIAPGVEQPLINLKDGENTATSPGITPEEYYTWRFLHELIRESGVTVDGSAPRGMLPFIEKYRALNEHLKRKALEYGIIEE